MKVVQDKNHFRTPGHMTEVRNDLRRKVRHPRLLDWYVLRISDVLIALHLSILNATKAKNVNISKISHDLQYNI
jgi:hypothetical protein